MGASQSTQLQNCERCGDRLEKFNRHRCRKCSRQICEKKCATKRNPRKDWECILPCPPVTKGAQPANASTSIPPTRPASTPSAPTTAPVSTKAPPTEIAPSNTTTTIPPTATTTSTTTSSTAQETVPTSATSIAEAKTTTSPSIADPATSIAEDIAPTITPPATNIAEEPAPSMPPPSTIAEDSITTPSAATLDEPTTTSPATTTIAPSTTATSIAEDSTATAAEDIVRAEQSTPAATNIAEDIETRLADGSPSVDASAPVPNAEDGAPSSDEAVTVSPGASETKEGVISEPPDTSATQGLEVVTSELSQTINDPVSSPSSSPVPASASIAGSPPTSPIAEAENQLAPTTILDPIANPLAVDGQAGELGPLDPTSNPSEVGDVVREPAVAIHLPRSEETVVEPPTNSLPETVIDPIVTLLPEAVIEPTVNPLPEAVIEPIANPLPEAVNDPIVNPLPEAVIEPIANPSPETVIDPIVTLLPEAVIEPTVTLLPEAVIDPIANPSPETVNDPIVTLLPEAVIEPTVNLLPEAVIEPIANPSPETVIEPADPVAIHLPRGDETLEAKMTNPLPGMVIEPIVNPLPETVIDPTVNPLPTPVESFPLPEVVVESVANTVDKLAQETVAISNSEPMVQEPVVPATEQALPILLEAALHITEAADRKEPTTAEPNKKKGEAEEAAYQSSIITLSSILQNWLIVNDLLEGKEASTPDDEGPIHALHAALALLKNLYFLDLVIDNPELRARWIKIRDRICIGLIKDTKEFGNTSVSMGAAKLASFTTYIGLLNCGTGGIKYQLYAKKEGNLYLEAEYKPKSGANPNTLLGVGSFKPKAEGVSLEATANLLKTELLESPWKDKPDIPVQAFVTGTVRQHWEEAKEEEKKLMEEQMENLFGAFNIAKLSDSYFLPQDDEGRLELLGCGAMYANLERAGLLAKGTTIVGSFGIGRGSCQWMIMNAKGEPELIAHKAGMTNLKELAKVGRTVIREYCDNPTRLERFLDALEREEWPVFALKSGCTILLENKNFRSIKKKLMAPANFQVSKTVNVARNGQTNTVECTFEGSLDVLCAVAGFKLGGGVDLEVMYMSDGRRLGRADLLEEGSLVYLAPLGEPFCPPGANQNNDDPLEEEKEEKARQTPRVGIVDSSVNHKERDVHHSPLPSSLPAEDSIVSNAFATTAAIDASPAATPEEGTVTVVGMGESEPTKET